MVPSLRLTSPLFKRDLPELETGAAFPGGCLTASCYRRSLTGQHDACLLGLSSSRTESGQLACLSLSSHKPPHKVGRSLTRASVICLLFGCGENDRTLHGIARVWPDPGKILLLKKRV